MTFRALSIRHRLILPVRKSLLKVNHVFYDERWREDCRTHQVYRNRQSLTDVICRSTFLIEYFSAPMRKITSSCVANEPKQFRPTFFKYRCATQICNRTPDSISVPNGIQVMNPENLLSKLEKLIKPMVFDLIRHDLLFLL